MYDWAAHWCSDYIELACRRPRYNSCKRRHKKDAVAYVPEDQMVIVCFDLYRLIVAAADLTTKRVYNNTIFEFSFRLLSRIPDR